MYRSRQRRREVSTPLLWPEKSFDAKKLYYELPQKGLAYSRKEEAPNQNPSQKKESRSMPSPDPQFDLLRNARSTSRTLEAMQIARWLFACCLTTGCGRCSACAKAG